MNRVVLLFFRMYIYMLSFVYAIGFCLWLLYYSLRHPSGKIWKRHIREKPPACLMDPSYGRHGIAELQNINLHYVENGDRSKPLMLFIHGFPEFWYSWRHQLKEFSKDYWTVAVDLRGYGESDRPIGSSNYQMHKVIEDLRQLILFFGRNRAILVGHDWGGLLLWNFMDLHLDMVEKYIVISSPFHRNFVRSLVTRPTQFIRSWYCFFFQAPFLPELGLKMNDMMKFDLEMKALPESSITDEDIEAYKYMFSRPGAMKCAVDYYRANCGILHIGPRVLEYPPGAMIFGDGDKYLETNFLDVAKKEIHNLRTYVLKNAQHFVQQEQPERVNGLIYAYLNDEEFPEEKKQIDFYKQI